MLNPDFFDKKSSSQIHNTHKAQKKNEANLYNREVDIKINTLI